MCSTRLSNSMLRCSDWKSTCKSIPRMLKECRWMRQRMDWMSMGQPCWWGPVWILASKASWEKSGRVWNTSILKCSKRPTYKTFALSLTKKLTKKTLNKLSVTLANNYRTSTCLASFGKNGSNLCTMHGKQHLKAKTKIATMVCKGFTVPFSI